MGSTESGQCSWWEYTDDWGRCCPLWYADQGYTCYYPGRRRLSAQSKRASYSTKGKKLLQDPQAPTQDESGQGQG